MSTSCVKTAKTLKTGQRFVYDSRVYVAGVIVHGDKICVQLGSSKDNLYLKPSTKVEVLSDARGTVRFKRPKKVD